MAKSGSLETPYGANTYYRSVIFSWTGTASGNSTIINWTLKSGGSEASKSYGVATRTIDLKINGQSIFYTTNYEAIHTAPRATTYTPWGEIIKSGSLTINHNSNGEVSINVSLSANIYSTNVSKTGTFTLDKLATASLLAIPTFTLGNKDANNPYGLSPITVYQSKDKTTLLSNYGHKLKYKVGNSDYKYMTAIQYGMSSASNVFIYQQTPSMPEFTNSLAILFDPPETDYQYAENGRLVGTMVLETYSDTACSSNKLIGTCTLSMNIIIPDNFKPIINSASYVLDNTGYPNIANLGIALANITTISLNVNATSNINANIKSIDVTNGATKTYVLQTPSSTIDITSGLEITPRSGGTYIFDIIASDNKGLYSDKIQVGSINVYSYDAPKINNFVANRRGSSTNVAIYCDASPVSIKVGGVEKNAIASISLKYREYGTTTWNNYTGTTISNGVFVDVNNFNNTKKYELKIVVTDSMGGVSEQIQIVPKAETYIHFASRGLGIGIGKSLDYFDTQKRVELDPTWELRVHGEEIVDLIEDVVDDKISDYIVSQGKSGDWYYRKWNSGWAEGWINITATSDSKGNAHVSNTMPFTVLNDKYHGIQGSFAANGRSSARMEYTNMGLSNIDAYGYIGSATASVTCWFNIYVYGFYK